MRLSPAVLSASTRDRRALRRVTERTPVPIYQAQHYTTFVVREKLECGHESIVYPQGDPLIARHRECSECRAVGAVSVVPKKPCVSVSTFQRLRREAA